MSWESATGVLFADAPTAEQVDALARFLEPRRAELAACYAPDARPQRAALVRFLSRLFALYEHPAAGQRRELTALVEQTAVRLLAAPDFFPGVFRAALRDADAALLELVYTSLFTVIPASSDLAAVWFKQRLAAEKDGVKYAPQAWALNLLTSVQFLDIGADPAGGSAPATRLLCEIQDAVAASSESALKLVWALALFSLARQHYAAESHAEFHAESELDLGPLVEKLQVRAGVHWSVVLRDEIQVSLAGVGALVAALELVRAAPPALAPAHQLAQTAADAISRLAGVAKPTDTIMAALATAVKPYPALKHQPWLSPDTLALVKAKCPASIASLVSVAQTLSLDERIEYLREMATYVSVVRPDDLELGGREPEDAVGSTVRTSRLVTILPPRPTDHQGRLEIDSGTRGTLLGTDDGECLVMWYFTYSGWSLLGRIFENADLDQGNDWDPLTIELMDVIAMTPDPAVLAALSAGLARGDIVDLVARRLQMWLHARRFANTPLVFAFFVELASLAPARLWVLLDSIEWVNIIDSALVHDGLRRVLLALWPSFDAALDLHTRVVDNLTRIFTWQYQAQPQLDPSVLQAFRVLLPVSAPLRDELLSPSPLRQTSVAPLLANLNNRDVLEFCVYCITTTTASLSFRNSEPSYLETQLFAKSGYLIDRFISDHSLREPLIRLLSAMVLAEGAPPLLAFLETGQATKFRDQLVDIAEDKLQSSSSIAVIARFVNAIRRQEGLLALLRGELLPLLENRVVSFTDPASIVDVLEALRLVGSAAFKPATLAFLWLRAAEQLDPELPDVLQRLEVKRLAVTLLRKQISTDPASLKDVAAKQITELTPRLVQIEGARPTLHSRLKHNLRTKWPDLGDRTADIDIDLGRLDKDLANDTLWHASYRSEVVQASENATWIRAQTKFITAWCDFMAAACAHGDQLALAARAKQQWVVELLKANSSTPLPASLNQAEDVRAEAAFYILQQNLSPDIEILNLLLQQLTDITLGPVAEVPANGNERPRTVSLLQMVALMLSQFAKNVPAGTEPRLVQIVLGLLDIVIIKQTRLFNGSEELLRLHLSILRDAVALIGREGATKMLSPLVQSMTESGTDVSAVRAYALAPITAPALGELVLLYIQEWLPVGIMTDNFVRSGLTNMLIEAPLSRHIQKGDVLPFKQPALHSLWRRGILVVILRLLSQLGSRVTQESWLFLSAYGRQIATCFEQWRVGMITLALIEETVLVHSLISLLGQLEANPNDRVDLVFPKDELVQTIDQLSSHRKYLSTRVPATEDTGTILSELSDLRNFVLA